MAALSQFFTMDDCSKPSTAKKWVIPSIAIVLFVIMVLPQTRDAISNAMGGKSQGAIVLTQVVVFSVLFLAFWQACGVNMK